MKNLALLFSAAGLALAPPAAAKGDPARGKTVYQQRCAMCHSLEPGKSMIGPSLSGVSGRRAGSQSYAYSPAMRAAKISWNARAMEEFLAAPTQKVPGTKMAIRLADPDDRAAVAAFLTNGR